MAEQVKIRLKGGPCDGQNATVKRTGDLLPDFTCKATHYQPTGTVTTDGRVVYTTKKSQETPPPPAPTGTVKLTKAHSAWHHMLRRVFVDAPEELRRTAEARDALRLLRHRPRLR